MAFHKATRKQAKLRMAFDGPSGSGKTLTALKVAQKLGGSIALIDTEHGSASLYSNVVPFDTNELFEFSLRNYIDAIAEAAAAGYKNLIVDSLSHAWQGKGGALEQVDKAGGNKFTNGWKAVTPLYNQLIESILSYPGNLIATLRTKTAYEVVKNERGQAIPQKVGMAPVIREGSEYEFSFVLNLTREGTATVSKTRCQGAVFTVDEVLSREEICGKRVERLMAWLAEGASMSPVDTMREAIRLAASAEQLAALIPQLKTLTEPERRELSPLYTQKKSELAQEIA